MNTRLTDIDEIIRIGDEDTEFIEQNKRYFCGGRWWGKQAGPTDKLLKETFGNFFTFSKQDTIKGLYEKIDNSSLEQNIKDYAKRRLVNTRIAWLDESYIGTHKGVKANLQDAEDWDFEYCGIEFDLKNSIFPRNFKNYRSGKDIIADPEGFIREMFKEGSSHTRSNPAMHKQSNRFFMVYYSKKDKNYFSGAPSDKINTEFLKTNFKVKRDVFDKILDEFDKDVHVFNLKDVQYEYYGTIYEYKEVKCVICLIGEQENGEIKYFIVKNS